MVLIAVLKYKSGGTWYDLTVGMDQATADARYIDAVGYHAYGNYNASVPQGTYVDIPLVAVDSWGQGGGSISGGKYVVPKNGVYQIHVTGMGNCTAGVVQWALQYTGRAVAAETIGVQFLWYSKTGVTGGILSSLYGRFSGTASAFLNKNHPTWVDAAFVNFTSADARMFINRIG